MPEPLALALTSRRSQGYLTNPYPNPNLAQEPRLPYEVLRPTGARLRRRRRLATGQARVRDRVRVWARVRVRARALVWVKVVPMCGFVRAAVSQLPDPSPNPSPSPNNAAPPLPQGEPAFRLPALQSATPRGGGVPHRGSANPNHRGSTPSWDHHRAVPVPPTSLQTQSAPERVQKARHASWVKSCKRGKRLVGLYATLTPPYI